MTPSLTGSSVAIVALAAALLPATASSQTATLVKDINTQAATPIDRFQSYGYFGWTGSAVVFNGQSDPEGIEIWVSDGTPDGTTMLRDIYRGVDDGSPRDFARVGGVVYFTASDGSHGSELWRTDGTPLGTWLVKDTRAGSASGSPANLVASGDRLFFTADDGVNGRELWVSDGTEAGTGLTRDIRAGTSSSSPAQIVPTPSGVVFSANDGLNGTEVWHSDGTLGGTVQIVDVNPGAGSSTPRYFAMLLGFVYFQANDGTNGIELWRCTPRGLDAGIVRDIRVGLSSSSPSNLEVFGGRLYFAANDGTHGNELWVSDGSEVGTALLSDIYAGASSSSPSRLTATATALFFTANNGSTGTELWKVDGSPPTASLVKDVYPGSTSGMQFAAITRLTVTDFGVVFSGYDSSHGIEPWRSDGTGDGTEIIRDIRTGSSSSQSSSYVFLSTGDAVFFQADDGVDGDRPWTSDGTQDGTVSLTPLALTASGGAANYMTRCGNGLWLFPANDGISGGEPWVTDGSETGTTLLLDVYPGSMGSSAFPRTPFGERVPFVATAPGLGQELWITDCTAGGTTLLKDVNPAGGNYPFGTAVAGGRYFFDGDDGSSGRELWVSDGSPDGTTMVVDLNPGSASSTPGVYSFGDLLLFRADNGVLGKELWISNGTASGTSLVMDIAPGPGSSSPLGATVFSDRVVFWANDGITGTELWCSDGTSANTFRVADIWLGPDSSLDGSIWYFTEHSGFVYFAANDGVHGTELWRTDGTSAGTGLVADINSGAEGSLPQAMVSFGDTLYFIADDGEHGQELWRYDQTSGGAFLVRDLWPGQISSDPWQLRIVNGVLVFVATSPEHGSEVWVSNGTESGTRLLAEVNPGPTNSGPVLGAEFSGSLLFSAADIEYGREIFSTCTDRFFMDSDLDGHGDPDRPTLGCLPPPGYVDSNDDCDDAFDGTFPGASETCDALDNDCDGESDDPVFAGVVSAAQLSGSSCAVRLDWAPTSACSGIPVYNVYRSSIPGFEVGESTLLAACVTQAFWIDSSVSPGTAYHYIVRAENPSTGGVGPCYGGAEDNNSLEASTTPTFCSVAPREVLYLTASARDQEVQLEWVNPSASYGMTQVCWKTASFPVGPGDGVCVDESGVPGGYGTATHDVTSVGGIDNGTPYYYAAFVNSGIGGTGEWSGGRFISARPFNTSGAPKWGYSTPATALSPPGVHPGIANYSASNDRLLHSTIAGETGGSWPGSWVPSAMNAPSQSRPIIIPFGTPTVGGARTVALVGSHDGRVYAFDGDTGSELWASPVLGDAIQGSPSAMLTAYGGAYDLILVGTRTPEGDSRLYGLELASGEIAWSFDNGGGASGMGVVSSQPWIDAANRRVYFTSRRKPGGSNHTIWCLQVTDTTATPLWSRPLGDIDSSPTMREGTVYVGTNSGEVHALDPETGDDLWDTPYSSDDGSVRGYVWFDSSGGVRRLFFSTSNSLHALVDTGTSAAQLWAPVGLSSPTPVIVIGDDLYLGSTVNNGSLLRLDKTSGTLVGSITLGDPTVAKHVGNPAFDGAVGQIVVGTEQGAVYAVTAGF